MPKQNIDSVDEVDSTAYLQLDGKNFFFYFFFLYSNRLFKNWIGNSIADNDPNIKKLKLIRRQQCCAIWYKKLIYMREQWRYWAVLVCDWYFLSHSTDAIVNGIFFFQFMCPLIALFLCFGTIHSSITYKAPTELIQLDLAHINHPDVLAMINDRDPLFHQRALENVVENYNSSIRQLQSSVQSIKNGLSISDRFDG